MMSELKPCPFCGGQVRMKSQFYPHGKAVVQFSCQNFFCKAQTAFFSEEGEDEKLIEYLAIKRWNHREDDILPLDDDKILPSWKRPSFFETAPEVRPPFIAT